MKKRTNIILTLGVLLILSGCGGGGTTTTPIPNDGPTIASLSAPTVVAGTPFYAVGADLSSATGVHRVTFSIDNVPVGSDSVPPYGVVVDTASLGLAEGSHVLTADLYGTPASADLAQYGIELLNTKSVGFQVIQPGGPGISFSLQQPAPNAVVSGSITPTVSTTSFPQRVNFYVDGDWVTSDPVPPYSLAWDTSLYSNGEHTLTAIGDYGGGVQVGDRVPVSVFNGAPQHFVRLTSPLDEATLSGNAVVNLDAIGTPIRVQFYLDQQFLFEDTTPPFQFVLDTVHNPDGTPRPDGEYYLSAVAVFEQGETLQDVIQVRIQNNTTVKPPDTPLIAISNPLNGVAVSNSVTVQVNPVSGAYLSQVSFFIDGLQVFTDNDPPFQYTMNTVGLANGNHVIRILGVFADGSLLGFDTVNVFVNNTHMGPGS